MQSPPNQSKPKSISRRVFLKILAALPFIKTLPERSSKQKPIAEGRFTDSKLVFTKRSPITSITDVHGEVFVKDFYVDYANRLESMEWNVAPDEKRLAAVRAILEQAECDCEFYPIFGECSQHWIDVGSDDEEV